MIDRKPRERAITFEQTLDVVLFGGVEARREPNRADELLRSLLEVECRMTVARPRAELRHAEIVLGVVEKCGNSDGIDEITAHRSGIPAWSRRGRGFRC